MGKSKTAVKKEKNAIDRIMDKKEKTLKTIKIWARVGMSLEIPEEEYLELLEEAKEGNDIPGDLEFYDGDDLVQRFIKNGYADGETYIPGPVFEDIEYDRKREKKKKGVNTMKKTKEKTLDDYTKEDLVSIIRSLVNELAEGAEEDYLSMAVGSCISKEDAKVFGIEWVFEND